MLAAAACSRAAAPSGAPTAAESGPSPSFALVGALLPGGGPAGTVLVRDGRIAQLGGAVPAGVEERDVAGRTLIPGFLDAHVHLQFADPASVLAGGVTTVRDLGGPPDAAQALVGASPLRVLLAGRILTPVGGYPSTSWGADGTAREVADPDDAAVAVREQVDAGATVVKVALEDGGAGLPVFDLATLEAIIERAREAGLPVSAHVGSAPLLELALTAGVDELAHLPLYPVMPAEMVAVAEAAVVLTPTLEIRGGDEAALAAVAAFHMAGGTILYGTDLGNTGTAPGIERREVEALLAAGLTPREVLDAATSVPAAHLGLDTGELAVGRAADLVLLDGDPFGDPAAYDAVALVIAHGEPLG